MNTLIGDLMEGDVLVIEKEITCSRYHYYVEIDPPHAVYNRDNKADYTLQPGEEVTFIEDFFNEYGGFLRVERKPSGKALDLLDLSINDIEFSIKPKQQQQRR